MMNPLTLAGAVAAAGLLILPSVAGAQACRDGETLDQCWARLSREPDTLAAAVKPDYAEGEQKERLSGKLAELGAAALAGEAFSIADFLPLFAGSLGSSEQETEDGAKSIQLNLPFSVLSGPQQRLRVEAIARDPTVYAPLSAALPDSVRAARVEELEKGFDELDDVELVAAYNFESQRFGRDFDRYDELHNQIFGYVISSVATEEADAALLRFAELVEFSGDDLDLTRPECAQIDVNDSMSLRVDCLTDGGRRREIEEQLAATVLTEQRLDSLVQAELEANGFFRFADLINNQPQINVEIARRSRKGLVGPNEWRGKIRYEHGFKNVNDLLKSCRPDEEQAECAVRYLRDERTTASLTRGDRVWLAAEYGQISDFAGSVAQEGDTASVTLGVQQRFTGSAGYGRSVGVDTDGTETGRIDVALSWEWTGDDPSREEDRAIFSANYSQRVNSDFTFGVGLAWASKPEFLGAVDRKFSTHFGVRYKLSQN